MKASTSKAPRDVNTKNQSKYRHSQRNPRPCGHCAKLQVRCIITPPLGTAALCHRCKKKGLTICPPHVPRTKRPENKMLVEDEAILLQRPYSALDEQSACGSPQSESSIYSRESPDSVTREDEQRTTESVTQMQSPSTKNLGSDYLSVLSIRLAETTVSSQTSQMTRAHAPMASAASNDYYYGGDPSEPFLFDMNEWPSQEESYAYTRL